MNWKMVVVFITMVAGVLVSHFLGHETIAEAILGMGAIVHAFGPSLLGGSS